MFGVITLLLIAPLLILLLLRKVVLPFIALFGLIRTYDFLSLTIVIIVTALTVFCYVYCVMYYERVSVSLRSDFLYYSFVAVLFIGFLYCLITDIRSRCKKEES